MDEQANMQTPETQPAPAPAHSEMALKPAGQLLKEAWVLYKEKLGTLLGLAAVPIVVSILGALLLGGAAFGLKSAGQGAQTAGVGIGALIFFLVLIVASILSTLGMIIVAKRRTEHLSIGQAMGAAKPLFWGYLLVSIMSGLIVGIGLILLIIPGIIFGLWYGFSTYVLVDQNKRGMSALSESKRLASGRLGATLWRYFVMIVIVIAISIVIGLVTAPMKEVGTVISNIVQWAITPWLLIYGYLFYEDFKRTRPV